VRLRITLEDRSYDVAVELLPNRRPPAREDRRPRAGVGAGAAPSADTMPEDRSAAAHRGRGRIHRGFAAAKDPPGHPVATIEAMKMQNTIGAPLDGVVEEVLVRLGETVKTARYVQAGLSRRRFGRAGNRS